MTNSSDNLKRALHESMDINGDLRTQRDRRSVVTPLTDDEVHKLRKMIESEARVQWAWSTARVWATWIAAVALGVTVGWDALGKIAKALVSR